MQNKQVHGEIAGMTPAKDFEAIVQHYQSALLRYASRLLNDPVAAQDVVQDAFIKLHKSRKLRHTSGKSLSSWLYRVTHHAAVDHIRRESRLKDLHEKGIEDSDQVARPRQQKLLEKKEAMELALRRLHELDASEQQVVILRVEEGLSYKEIAAITERSEGNVGCILHHAMKKLAHALKEAGAIG